MEKIQIKDTISKDEIEQLKQTYFQLFKRYPKICLCSPKKIKNIINEINDEIDNKNKSIQ